MANQARNTDRFIPATFPGATHINVSTFYGEGGMSYFTGTRSPRGYYALVQPVTREDRDGFVSTQFTMFDANAFKVFLLGATRFNAKTLAALDAKVATVAADVVKHMEAGDQRAAAALLDGLKAAA